MWLSTWRFVVENLVPPGGSTKAVLGKIRPDPSLLASDPSYCRLQFSTHLFNCAPPLPTRSQAQVCVKTKFGHFTRLRNPGPHTSVWSIIAGLSHLECVMFYTFHILIVIGGGRWGEQTSRSNGGDQRRFPSAPGHKSSFYSRPETPLLWQIFCQRGDDTTDWTTDTRKNYVFFINLENWKVGLIWNKDRSWCWWKVNQTPVIAKWLYSLVDRVNSMHGALNLVFTLCLESWTRGWIDDRFVFIDVSTFPWRAVQCT